MMLWSHFEAISLSLIWLNIQLSQPVSPKMAWNSLDRQGWPWTHGNPPNLNTKDCLWELSCLAEISYVTLGFSFLTGPRFIHLVPWHWWQKIILCFPVLQTVLQQATFTKFAYTHLIMFSEEASKSVKADAELWQCWKTLNLNTESPFSWLHSLLQFVNVSAQFFSLFLFLCVNFRISLSK